MLITRLKSLQQKVAGNPEPQPPFAAWTSHMSVQVKLLDNDHKKLLILLSELHDGAINGYASQILEMIFESLMRSLRAHFVHEEQLFTETAFPSSVIHEREHDHLIKRLKVLQERFRNCTDSNSFLEVILLLKSCLFNHIECSDQEYVPHLRSKEIGAILAASEAQPAVVLRKQAVGLRRLQGAF